MNGEDKAKLRGIFKEMLIDMAGVYDPSGIITDTIKADTGMGFSKYLEKKSEEFIGRLKDERLI